MPSSLPPTSLLVSLVAEPEAGLLSRITVVLARLDLFPLAVYARLRSSRSDGGPPFVEVDLRLGPDAAERSDRLVALLRGIVGVERVMVALAQPVFAPATETATAAIG
jgi:hypothetical protein